MTCAGIWPGLTLPGTVLRVSIPPDPTANPPAGQTPDPAAPPPLTDQTAVPAAPPPPAGPAAPAPTYTPVAPAPPGYAPVAHPMGSGYAPAGYAMRPPSSVTTAAVLAYINSGLLFLCGLFFVAAGAVLNDLIDQVGFIPGGDAFRFLLFVFALVPIALGVLLVVSARQLQKGSNRVFLITMSALTSVLALLMLIGTIDTVINPQPDPNGATTNGPASLCIAVCLLALAAGPLIAASTKTAGEWIEMRRGYPLG